MDHEWSKNDIQVEGIQLHYTRLGDGNHPTVVLAHGFSDNGLCWTPVARKLAKGYDLILPDARGHGLSARVQAGEKVNMAADLAGLIRGLGLQPAVVGGHSMGASISAEMAASHPGLARALILEDPAWFLQTPAHAEKTAAQQPADPISWLLEIFGKPLEEIIAKCREQNPTWQEAELQPWAESKQQFDLNFFQIESMFHADWQQVVPAIECPTLLITADPEKGALVTPQIAQVAVDLNPRVQPVHVPGAGHSIRRENFLEFMRVVREFLDSLVY
jgi:pimeloyl-ACP methyl ester carboxylesterase